MTTISIMNPSETLIPHVSRAQSHDFLVLILSDNATVAADPAIEDCPDRDSPASSSYPSPQGNPDLPRLVEDAESSDERPP
jgi:hypothetical protein